MESIVLFVNQHAAGNSTPTAGSMACETDELLGGSVGLNARGVRRHGFTGSISILTPGARHMTPVSIGDGPNLKEQGALCPMSVQSFENGGTGWAPVVGYNAGAARPIAVKMATPLS